MLLNKLKVVRAVKSDQLVVDESVSAVLLCQLGNITDVLLLKLIVKVYLELLLLILELRRHFPCVEVAAAVVLVEDAGRKVLRVQNFDVFPIDHCENERLRQEKHLVNRLAITDVKPIEHHLGLL